MAKYREEAYGDVLYQSFLDALQEYVGTTAPNFHLGVANNTTVQVVAGANSAQVGLGIDGLWRYISATVNASVTGAAGLFDIFATCGPNNFVTNPTPPPPEIDDTVYAFALQVLAHGTTPTVGGGVSNYRLVGQLDWDGAKITGVRNYVGETSATDPKTSTAPTAAIVPTRSIGAASQAAPLGTWETSSGTIVAKVTPTGGLLLSDTLTGTVGAFSGALSATTLTLSGSIVSSTTTATGDITARFGSSTAVLLGNAGPSGQSGISFQGGEANSVLYRSGAGALTSPAAWTFGAAGLALSVTNNASVGGTLSIGGTSTLAAVNASGAYTQSGVAANTFTGASTFSAAGTALTVTNAASLGALTVSGTSALAAISASGAYTQSGVSANTFTGATTFSAAGTALTVTNSATVGSALSIGATPATTGDLRLRNTGSISARNSANTADVPLLSLSSGTNLVQLDANGAGARAGGALTVVGLLTATGGVSVPSFSNITLGDFSNIVLGTVNGTKIGTSKTQMLGFFNQAPAAQVAAPTQFAVNSATNALLTAPLPLTTSSTLGDVIAWVSRMAATLEGLGLLGLGGTWAS